MRNCALKFSAVYDLESGGGGQTFLTHTVEHVTTRLLPYEMINLPQIKALKVSCRSLYALKLAGSLYFRLLRFIFTSHQHVTSRLS